MASSTLDKIATGSRIFLDSTIFIYHFTGSSEDCRHLLQRCERGEITGLSSVVVLAEIAHRLMLIEAVTRKFLKGKNLVQKLRDHPEVIKKLDLYQEQVERILLMGIEILPLDLKTMLVSSELRTQYGLLMNDSLIAASALEAKCEGIASADPDFARVKSLRHFAPPDLT
jgi:predicted nucleic acid-binding protein